MLAGKVGPVSNLLRPKPPSPDAGLVSEEAKHLAAHLPRSCEKHASSEHEGRAYRFFLRITAELPTLQ